MSSVLDEDGNKAFLRSLRPGDGIEFKGNRLYSHWGLYAGDGKVIHKTGDDGNRLQSGSGHLSTICGQQYSKACVRMDNFHDVVGDSTAVKNNNKDSRFRPNDEDQIIEKAKSMIGKTDYNVFSNNCEHFVSYCTYGVSKSDQADNVINFAKVVGAGVLTGAAVGAGVLLYNRSNKPQREHD